MSGISFALLLVFMQLGFLQGAKTAAASIFEIFHYDLDIVSDKYKFVGAPDQFDRMRLIQATVLPEVDATATMSMGRGTWTERWHSPASWRGWRATRRWRWAVSR